MQTVLTKAAAIGAKELQVANMAIFKVGDRILIGERETKTVTGSGSLILDTPLIHEHGKDITVRNLGPGDPLRGAGWAGSPNSRLGTGFARTSARAQTTSAAPTFRTPKTEDNTDNTTHVDSPKAKPMPRSKEAEDANPHKRPPPPFNTKDRKFRRGGSFTEDSVGGDGWVKTTDPATGRAYWFHHVTMETSWEKPQSSKSQKAAGASSKAEGTPTGTQRPSSAQQQKRPASAKSGVSDIAPDVKNLEEAEEIARVKEDVRTQLDSTRKEDIASRKKTFKFLCLRWHPDKNAENAELATAVFQFLQSQRDWYLKEA
jgi:hypothetical protein